MDAYEKLYNQLDRNVRKLSGRSGFKLKIKRKHIYILFVSIICLAIMIALYIHYGQKKVTAKVNRNSVPYLSRPVDQMNLDQDRDISEQDMNPK